MLTPHLTTVDQIDLEKFNHFISRIYPQRKSEFLRKHGTWWHRGAQNRWVLLVGEQIAAYCALIPTKIVVEGQVKPAIWWVDLVVAPEFRGQGLQSIFDQKIRELTEIKLGFPNEIAAKIHKKHNWGVRDDLQVMLLPLQPTKVQQVQRASGLRGYPYKTAALLLTPWAFFQRQKIRKYQPLSARRDSFPTPDLLADIFKTRKDPAVITTYRDVDFFQWRYFDSPGFSEYNFYTAGDIRNPSHYMITRTTDLGFGLVTRILDLFGDFNDRNGTREILRLGIKNAILAGANQVTTLASLPELSSLLHSEGFILTAQARFCWFSDSSRIMSSLGERCHWTLTDSDNDTPD